MILIAGLDFEFIVDEGPYHIKVIESFAASWPRIELADYPSASAPLSYVVRVAFGNVVGFEIWKLRSLSAIATFLAAYLFYRLSKRHNLPHPLLSSLILLFFPYIFFFSFTIYPMGIALLFGMGALMYYLMDDPAPNDLFKGSVLATLAVFCRQIYIVLPMGMVLFELWRGFHRGRNALKRELWLRLLALALPLMILIPLLILWGGLHYTVRTGGSWRGVRD